MNSIYCSNDKIQIVSGTATKKEIKIKSNKDVFLPEGTLINGMIIEQELFKEALLNALPDASVQGKEIRIIVDSTSVLTKVIKVPSLAIGSLFPLIRMEFETARNQEELVYDYRVLSNKNSHGGSTVLACAVAKSFVESYTELFKDIGYKVVFLDVIQSAIISLADNFNLFRKESCTLLVFDGTNIVLNLFIHGIYTLSTRYRVIETPGTDAFYNEISGRISIHNQFMSTQKLEQTVTQIYFCGNFGDNQELVRRVEAEQGVSGKIFNLGKKISGTPGNKMYEYIYPVAGLITMKEHTNNFVRQLNVDVEKNEKIRKISRISASIIFLVVVLIGIYVGLLGIRGLLHSEKKSLTEYINSTSVQEHYNNYMELEKITTKTEKIRNLFKEQELLFQEFPNVGAELFEIIESSSAGLITMTDITYKKDPLSDVFQLEIMGTSSSVENMTSFIKKLEDRGVTYKNNGYKLSGENYNFSVICVLESEGVE